MSETAPGDEGFYSFLPLLEKYLKERKPKRILEWGPGVSTVTMFHLAPWAEIVSIEDDREWFLHWHSCLSKESNNSPNLKLYLLRLDGNYVEAPLAMGKFDLIFVDGVDGTDDVGTGSTRPPCLEVAAKILSPGGVVLLHDAERE